MFHFSSIVSFRHCEPSVKVYGTESASPWIEIGDKADPYKFQGVQIAFKSLDQLDNFIVSLQQVSQQCRDVVNPPSTDECEQLEALAENP